MNSHMDSPLGQPVEMEVTLAGEGGWSGQVAKTI